MALPPPPLPPPAPGPLPPPAPPPVSPTAKKRSRKRKLAIGALITTLGALAAIVYHVVATRKILAEEGRVEAPPIPTTTLTPEPSPTVTTSPAPTTTTTLTGRRTRPTPKQTAQPDSPSPPVSSIPREKGEIVANEIAGSPPPGSMVRDPAKTQKPSP